MTISLVIGGIGIGIGIGIMNIMLVSVTERIREIGLRMASAGNSSPKLDPIEALRQQ